MTPGQIQQLYRRRPRRRRPGGPAVALGARALETLRDVIVPGLDLVPISGVTLLVAVRDELVIVVAGRESRLREALRIVSGDYDLILIDYALSLDQLTGNGLTTADGVVIVTHSKLWSANGPGQPLTTIDSVRAPYNPTLRIAGGKLSASKPSTTATSRSQGSKLKRFPRAARWRSDVPTN